jgi:hypothetical protein
MKAGPPFAGFNFTITHFDVGVPVPPPVRVSSVGGPVNARGQP